MKRMMMVCVMLFAWLGNPVASVADTFPQLIYTGEKRPAACAHALQFAKAAFDSGAFLLYAPIRVPPNLVYEPERFADSKETAASEDYTFAVPANLGSDLVLATVDVNISERGATLIDPEIFDNPGHTDTSYFRYLHWQKTAHNGHRLALYAFKAPQRSWRGYLYILFAFDEKIRKDEFLAEAEKIYYPEDAQKLGAIGYTVWRPWQQIWRPPLIFREKDSGGYWVVEAGDDYTMPLGDWRISTLEPTGVEQPCKVRFSPRGEWTALLPPAVRRLERLLKETIGPGGSYEGSLQQTDILGRNVEKTWANVIMRPWALSDTEFRSSPYNSRAEVDKGLQEWSRKSASYRALYQEILRQYPKAERALVKLYRKNFRLTPGEAKKRAVWALDIAFRAHYVFHTDDRHYYDTPPPNPWLSK